MYHCLYLDKILATPPLNGLILPGITRRSILELAKEWDEFLVEERIFTMNELIELNKDKKVSPCAFGILFKTLCCVQQPLGTNRFSF